MENYDDESPEHFEPDTPAPPAANKDKPKAKRAKDGPHLEKCRVTRQTPITATACCPTPAESAPTLPMVQVMGPNGAAFVFRPWTTEDILKMSKQLPKPEKGGSTLAKAVAEFIREFSPTSTEMARILGNNMSPAQFGLLRDCFLQPVQPATPAWPEITESEPKDNTDYRAWQIALRNRITEQFPTQCNLNKVSKCTQQNNEPVEDYLERLNIVFDDYSGVTRPDPYPGIEMTPYESLLKNAFMEGMLSHLAETTKTSCIMWADATVRLTDVLRHARHAQARRLETECEKEKQQKEAAHKAQLTLPHYAVSSSCRRS